jgi:hypothetical protein
VAKAVVGKKLQALNKRGNIDDVVDKLELTGILERQVA